MTTTFRSKNKSLHLAAVAELKRERPMTLRQLFYRLVSAGELSNTQVEYKRLGKVMTRLREAGDVPFSWMVDHVRSTLKPSSWSGLADFGDTVRRSYRKDLWASMPHHVEVFVEKDAIAGTIQPVTKEYDIALHVCRGYASLSFVGEIAELWKESPKPVFAYYVGDFDPSGFDIERDLREKLARYSGLTVHRRARVSAADLRLAERTRCAFMVRLAVLHSDFHTHNLISLPAKQSDNRMKGFVEEHGDSCAEVDALPPTELRRRVRQAIERHIDQERWERLKQVEGLEQQTLLNLVDGWQREETEPRFGSDGEGS